MAPRHKVTARWKALTFSVLGLGKSRKLVFWVIINIIVGPVNQWLALTLTDWNWSTKLKVTNRRRKIVESRKIVNIKNVNSQCK